MPSPLQQAMLMIGQAGGPPIPGLVGWWDMSVTPSISLTGNLINSVADFSGSGSTMNFVSVKPVYDAKGFNSKFPTATYNQSTPALKATSFPMGAGNELTAFWVGYVDAGWSPANARYLSYAAPTRGGDNGFADSWGMYRSGSSSTDALLTRNSISATSSLALLTGPHRFIITINSGGVMTFYVDGVASATATSSGNWVTGGTASIGAQSPNATAPFLDGQWSEAGISIIYQGPAGVAALDAYLAAKWWPPGGTPTGWNFANWDVTLSNNSLTATHTATTNSDSGARSTSVKSSGSYYYEVTRGQSTGASDATGFMLNTAGYLFDVHNGQNCSIVFRNGGQIYSNNAFQASLGAFAVNDNVGHAINLTSRLYWGRLNGGLWNNSGAANPATGVGGAPVAAGAFTPCSAFCNGSAVNDTNTANFGQSAYLYTPPAGFGNWTV